MTLNKLNTVCAGMETEESVGGLHQVLPTHQTPELPGVAATARTSADRRVGKLARSTPTLAGTRDDLHLKPGKSQIC